MPTYEEALLAALDALNTLADTVPNTRAYDGQAKEITAMFNSVNAWHDAEEALQRSAKEQGC